MCTLRNSQPPSDFNRKTSRQRQTSQPTSAPSATNVPRRVQGHKIEAPNVYAASTVFARHDVDGFCFFEPAQILAVQFNGERSNASHKKLNLASCSGMLQVLLTGREVSRRTTPSKLRAKPQELQAKYMQSWRSEPSLFATSNACSSRLTRSSLVISQSRSAPTTADVERPSKSAMHTYFDVSLFDQLLAVLMTCFILLATVVIMAEAQNRL